MTMLKVRTVLRSMLTWLTLAAVVLQIVISEVRDAFGMDGTAGSVVTVLVRVAAWIGVAVAIIRRTIEVPRGERSLL